jgi:hypothetical protein
MNTNRETLRVREAFWRVWSEKEINEIQSPIEEIVVSTCMRDFASNQLPVLGRIYPVESLPVRCRVGFSPAPSGLAPSRRLARVQSSLLLHLLRRLFFSVIYSPHPPLQRGLHFLPATPPSQPPQRWLLTPSST